MTVNSYLEQLPVTLETVHRRTIIATLAEFGITHQDDSWDALNEAVKKEDSDGLLQEHLPLHVRFTGKHTFGPILGKEVHLLEAEPTDTTFQLPDLCLGNIAASWIQVSAGDPETNAFILLSPNSPPVAVHEDNYYYISREKPDLITGQITDENIVATVQEVFGEEAVEYLTEETAQGLVHALLSEKTWMPRIAE